MKWGGGGGGLGVKGYGLEAESQNPLSSPKLLAFLVCFAIYIYIYLYIQSNLYIMVLYIAVTLYIGITQTTSQKSCLIFTVKFTYIQRSSVYNGCGHPLDFPN